MNTKQKIIASVAGFGGLIGLGLGALAPAAHAATPLPPVVAAAPAASEAPGMPEVAETPGSPEANDSGGATEAPGGHEDPPGQNVDHQFEGNE